jgi:hypothetical protein
MSTISDLRVRQLGGWALLVSAAIGLVVVVALALDVSSSTPLALAQLMGSALFLLGLPAIQATQPATERLGQLGLALIGLAAAIAFAAGLLLLSGVGDIPPGVPITSALAGLAGDVLVAVLTLRARVFPAWVGWLLASSGVLNLVTGLLPKAVDLTALAVCGALLGVVAIAGYGGTVLGLCRAAVGVH